MAILQCVIDPNLVLLSRQKIQFSRLKMHNFLSLPLL